VALDHDVRKLAEDLARANSKVSVARLELERLRRDAENPPATASVTAPRWKHRSGSARLVKKRSRPSAREAEKLEAEARRIGEDHAATRAALAALEERHRARSATTHGPASSSKHSRRQPIRRDSTIAEIERVW